MESDFDWMVLERERVDALRGYDAKKYAELCSELGIKPEDKILYNQGEFEFEFGKLEKIVDSTNKPIKKRKRSVSNAVYRKFYAEGKKLSESIFESTNAKRELLLSHFPKRFGGNRRNPVYEMPSEKVGSLFNHVRNYAKRRVNE